MTRRHPQIRPRNGSGGVTNVIDIRDWKKPQKDGDPEPVWMVSLDVFRDDAGHWTGRCHNFNDQDGLEAAERLRVHADALDELSFLLRQQAERMEPSERGECLATAHVFANSMVRTRVNDDKVVSDEQILWLLERFDDAKEAVVRP